LESLGIKVNDCYIDSVSDVDNGANLYYISTNEDGLAYYTYSINYVPAENDAFIAVTLKSGLTFTGAGTESSPYTITASNS